MAIKVKEVNLEKGHPIVADAMQKLVNGITTAKGSRCKAVIIIHGYGSSGEGGAIKTAAKAKLKEPVLRGIVRDHVAGEAWQMKKKAFLDVCPQLREWNRYIDGNKGITVVLLK